MSKCIDPMSRPPRLMTRSIALSPKTRRAVLAAVLATAALAPHRALAAYPERPIRWIVAYSAGGGSDTLARMLATAMSPRLGQTIVIENRPGAATNIGAEAAAKAPPDGYTVFTADNGTLVFNPILFRRLPYNPERDFRPVALYARYHLVLAVKKDSAIRSAQDYLAAARQRPGELVYGSSGVGSPHHLAMERFQREVGIRLSHAPYRGGAPGLNDLMAGNLESQLIDFATGGEAMRSGQVRPIAVASGSRFEALPDLPTFRELGARDYEAYAWQGLVAPARTPDPLVERLSAELLQAMGQEGIRSRMRDIGVEPLSGGPAEFTAILDAERAVWVPLVRDLGITLE